METLTKRESQGVQPVCCLLSWYTEAGLSFVSVLEHRAYILYKLYLLFWLHNLLFVCFRFKFDIYNFQVVC